MTEATVQGPTLAQRQVLLKVWIGLVVLLFALTGAGFFLVSLRKAPPVDPKMVLVLEVALGALSLITAIVIYGLLPYMARKIGYFLFSTLRWAFAASISLYGLVLFLLGASKLVFLCFLGGSLLLLILLFPRERDRLRFAPPSA